MSECFCTQSLAKKKKKKKKKKKRSISEIFNFNHQNHSFFKIPVEMRGGPGEPQSPFRLVCATVAKSLPLKRKHQLKPGLPTLLPADGEGAWGGSLVLLSTALLGGWSGVLRCHFTCLGLQHKTEPQTRDESTQVTLESSRLKGLKRWNLHAYEAVQNFINSQIKVKISTTEEWLPNSN